LIETTQKDTQQPEKDQEEEQEHEEQGNDAGDTETTLPTEEIERSTLRSDQCINIRRGKPQRKQLSRP
jgi:hypothetical protein